MRKITLLLGLLGLAAGLAARSPRAEVFPEELVYRYYVRGHYAGRCVIESVEKEETFSFNSKSEVQTAQLPQTLECYSEFDRETLAPRYYSYRGTKGGSAISGAMDFTPTLVKGTVEINDDAFPSKLDLKDQTILFENYVMEHQTIMLATLARSSEPFIRFSLFFPSDFTSASCVAMIESEVELPLRPKPTVCQKFSITIQSSDTFYGYFDPDRRLAVYMDYPASAVEIFLESAWGDNPPQKYESPSAADPHDH